MKPKVYPSELRLYHYCPRLLFFETHMGRGRVGLLKRLDLFIRSLIHAAAGLWARLKGMRVEEPMEADMGAYVLKGRPDQYSIRDGEALVVELKTSRKPREGAWLGDYLQALSYVLILKEKGAAKRARVGIKYLDGSASFEVKEEHLELARKAAFEVMLTKEGVIPFANRSDRRCSRCAYREECEALGDLWGEMGEWVKERRVIA
ncbi:MAG: CRISPR-associated protein Cas4 [Acidilobaceae archaeon]|nr:CRISPR-associated protein Cas4 [Acidilobaceae archaeon]